MKTIEQLNRGAVVKPEPSWTLIRPRRPRAAPPDQKVATALLYRLDAMPVNGVFICTKQEPPDWTPSRTWFYDASKKLSIKLRILNCPDRWIVFRVA